MCAVLAQYPFLVALIFVGGLALFYKLGYAHGNKNSDNKLDALLFRSLRENSTYEVLGFASRDEEYDAHVMFLKNIGDKNNCPLAAVKEMGLFHNWKIGDIVTTNDDKKISKATVVG